jgi:hypothetical protein
MLLLSIGIEPYAYAQHKLVKLMSSFRANVLKKLFYDPGILGWCKKPRGKSHG